MARKVVWRFPENAERDYQRLLTTHVGKVGLMAEREILHRWESWLSDAQAIPVSKLVRTDDFSEDINAAMAAIRAQGDALVNQVVLRMPTIYSMVSMFNDTQFRQIVKAGTGTQLPPSKASLSAATHTGVSHGAKPVMPGLGIDVYRAEPWLASLQSNWISQNISLVKYMTDDQLKNVETVVRQGVIEGRISRDISSRIREITGVSTSRAKLIAQDQVGKANAGLSEFRMRSVGVTEYYWRGLLDSRERPEHLAREGKVFEFSKPPSDGNPGYPIKCRCYAEPKWPKGDE